MGGKRVMSYYLSATNANVPGILSIRDPFLSSTPPITHVSAARRSTFWIINYVLPSCYLVSRSLPAFLHSHYEY